MNWARYALENIGFTIEENPIDKRPLITLGKCIKHDMEK